MYEDHLNLRAQAQPATPVVGSDGETRTHRRAMSRKLMSIFGMVELGLRERASTPCGSQTSSRWLTPCAR